MFFYLECQTSGGKELSVLNLIVWYICIFSIYGLIYYGLKRLKVPLQFRITFFLISIIYMTIPPWDCFVPEQQGWYFDLTALWGVTIILMGLSFYVLYGVAQKQYEGEFNHKKNIMFGVLVLGCTLFYGVFEDFSVFIYKGIHYFNPNDAWWHYTWFYNLFPLYYLQGVPGIILIIIALSWSVKHREK